MKNITNTTTKVNPVKPIQLSTESEVRKFDKEEAGKYFDLLGIGLDEPVIFQTFDDQKGGEKNPELIRTKRQTLEEFAPVAQRLNQRGAGIYFAVNKFQGDERKTDKVIEIRGVFADLDRGLPKGDFPIEPTVLVETSPGRYQAFWRVDRLTPEEFKHVMDRLVSGYGADRGARDLARVLRLPGSWHVKDSSSPYKVHIVSGSGETYSREAVLKAFAPVEKQNSLKNIEKALRYFEPKAVIHNRAILEQVVALLKSHFEEDETGKGKDLLLKWCERVPIEDRRVSNGEDESRTVDLDLIGELWQKAPTSIRDSRQVVSEIRKLARFVGGDTVDWPKVSPTTNTPNPRCPDNIRAALDALDIRFYKNVFDRRYYVEGFPDFSELNDECIRALFVAVIELGLQVTKEFLTDVVLDLARQEERHPVREYLDKVQGNWDGVPRIDHFLSKYAGAEDTRLNQAFGSLFLMAAVRRIRQPGSKFDQMLVLVGEQNAGKSSLVKIMASPEWFDDCLALGADPKTVLEQASGKWLIEISEMRGSNREIEAIKAMISRTCDRAALKYEKFATEAPRSFLLVGTANPDEFLVDATGNRRYWPVEVGKIDFAALERDRDQLWAEAAVREAEFKGRLELPAELRAAAAEAQNERMISDPIYESIAAALGDVGGTVEMETLYEIIGLGEEKRERREPRHRQAIGKAMRRLGWKKQRNRIAGERVYRYMKEHEVQRSFSWDERTNSLKSNPMGFAGSQRNDGAVVSLPTGRRRKPVEAQPAPGLSLGVPRCP